MMNKSKIIGLTICCAIFLALSPVVTAEDNDQKILQDSECDVYELSEEDLGLTATDEDDFEGMDLKTTCKPDVDIKQITCTKNNDELSIEFEIFGEFQDGTSLDKLEELGEALNNTEGLDDLDNLPSSLNEDIEIISYVLMINTTSNQYTITYSGGNCTLSNNSYDMFMAGGTEIPYEKENGVLSVTIDIDENEEVENISAYTQYMKAGFLSIIDLGGEVEIYMDIAPNPSFTVSAMANPQIAKVDEEIKFSATVIEGTKPYEFEWDFGDGSTSDEQNPTHQYSEEGLYEVNLVVTDDEDNTTQSTIEVNITNGKNSAAKTDISKQNKNKGLLGAALDENQGLVAFIALVAVILIVGLAVLYYISKR